MTLPHQPTWGPVPHPFPGPPEPETVPGAAPSQLWFAAPAEPVGLYEQLLQRRIVLASGHEIDEIRADMRAYRVLTAAEARDYGLVTEIIAGPARAR